ncbi:MAG: hypothetical protein MI756_08680, partial [Chromatiales bacterium]|nr:hypothetical protein [Chromatiales bacterium]
MLKSNVLIFLVSLIFLTGCASKSPTYKKGNHISDHQLYQLYIDEDGHLLHPISQKIVHDEASYIEEILNNFEFHRKNNKDIVLTIFIHGGLNTFENAKSKVEFAKDKILSEGKYPLFVSWNSGALTNYGDHLLLLRRGVKSSVLGPMSSPFVLLEDSLRSIARFPASTYNVLFGQNSVRISNYSKEEKAASRALREIKTQGFQIFKSSKNTGHTFKDWMTLWNPTKLVTAPFVDGLGTGAWNSMLRRTDLVLRKDLGFEGESESKTDTAVTKFFTKYNRQYPKRDTVIIGHSMGTIIANNVVSK